MISFLILLEPSPGLLKIGAWQSPKVALLTNHAAIQFSWQTCWDKTSAEIFKLFKTIKYLKLNKRINETKIESNGNICISDYI